MEEPRRSGDTTPIVVTAIAPMPGAEAAGTTPIPSGTVVTTPDHLPNLLVQVFTPLMAIVARAGVVFFQSMSGLVVVGGTTGLIPAHDFLELVAKSANLSLCVVGASVISSLVTIFSNLEKRFPLLRA
jgi:hypothetical protein